MEVQKCQKSRFFKSAHTLTTNQLRENTHPTKVVSPPKRFSGTLQCGAANRIFAPKNHPFSPSKRPLVVSEGENVCFGGEKMRFAAPHCRAPLNLFGGETTLVGCVFSRSWSVVEVWTLLKNRDF